MLYSYELISLLLDRAILFLRLLFAHYLEMSSLPNAVKKRISHMLDNSDKV